MVEVAGFTVPEPEVEAVEVEEETIVDPIVIVTLFGGTLIVF